VPIESADALTRTVYFAGTPKVIVRPSVSMVFYSRASFGAVKSAVAQALELYLRLTPADALRGIHRERMDPVTGEEWSPFDADQKQVLFEALRNTPAGEEDFNVILGATLDGQAGDYGFAFSGINFELAEDADQAESVLRLDFPWNLLQQMSDSEAVQLFGRIAAMFPSCSGNAGMSYIHPLTFMPESGDEIARLSRRYLGFDLAHDFVALEIRHKVHTAHWLNLLDEERMAALGGFGRISSALGACDVRRCAGGLLIRSARLPPIADVNRRTPDIGQMPEVARFLQPIRFENGLLVGMGDSDAGRQWLGRLDTLPPRPWNNG
jgi:hypothetical protein